MRTRPVLRWRPAWQVSTGGQVESSPTIVNGVVYIGSDAGLVLAIAESTGTVLWTSTIASPGVSSPAVDESAGLLVIGDSSGNVDAISTSGANTGSLVWSFPTDGTIPDTPIISGGRVYAGSSDGSEYALSESTGSLVWSTSIGGSPSATASVYQEDLFVGNSAGTLFNLSTANGTTNWTVQTHGAITGISTTSGLIYAESANGWITGFRPGSTETVWLAQTGAGLSTTPSISDNAVIVGAGDGSLRVYTPYTEPMN